MTEMGSLFRVKTVSRWLRDARQAAYDGIKHLLKERLRLSSHEFEGLLAAIASQFEVSLSEILVKEEPKGSPSST